MSSKIKTFDILLPLIPTLISIVGIAVIYSLVYGTNDADLASRQGIFVTLGVAAMVTFFFVDYRSFRSTSWILYVLTILLLIYVDFFGKIAGGAARWINLGFFQLQPSELAKVFLILFYASFYSGKIGKIHWRDILIAFLLFLPPLFLILKEPDLGTALVICFIFIALFFVSKPNKWQGGLVATLIVVMSLFLIFSALRIKPFENLLQDYQRNRILSFVDPNLDPYGKGYNVKQAQIAIGSGGLLGRGLGHGSQSQLQFLPKPHTDFIFSGIAESFGFLGTAIFLALYGFLIVKIVNVAYLARDNFGMLVCFGTAAMLFFQILINIGMNLGLAPVTGIPLPFASSGGTAMVVYLFNIGIIQNVFIRHKKISF